MVVTVVSLLAVVCVGLSAVTTLTLRHFLLREVDDMLAGPARGPARPSSHTESDRGPAVPVGLPPGTVTARIVAGQVTAARMREPEADEPGEERSLSPQYFGVLTDLPADGRFRTRDLGDLGDYRLVARTAPDGDVIVLGVPLKSVEDTLWRMIAAQTALVAVGMLLVGGAGALLVRAELRPLRRVAATAGRVAELPLARGEVALSVRVPPGDTDQRTEVGQVGAALDRLLTHVGDALAVRHASELRVRQFVADASHELRTPLAAIRGYAELTRRGEAAVPADVGHALRRIESESIRMTGLVDDLLLLARLDAGRPLVSEPVDLSAIVVDAVSDAHAAGPDHHWRLDLPDVAVWVSGDPMRLHQVVGNLLANARVHTPPGTRITIGLAVAGDRVVLEVADDGPGIPEQIRGEVFERFARADTSRSRTSGSTGLGLAIVAAVVEAHGGNATVDSRPGRTVFQVRLPALAPDMLAEPTVDT